jgi:glycine betaine/proline transport system ATP-binding protein
MSSGGTSIEIRGLYKIFGTTPGRYVEAVRNGMTKAELVKLRKHIFGLSDISISIQAGKTQVVMGLSGSGKSTLIRHINRLILLNANLPKL